MKSDVDDLLIKNRINGLDLISSLVYLRIIFKKIDKIIIVKDMETNNMLKNLETERIDELELLEENLNFKTSKTSFWGRPNSIEKKNRIKKANKKKDR